MNDNEGPVNPDDLERTRNERSGACKWECRLEIEKRLRGQKMGGYPLVLFRLQTRAQ